MTGCPPGKISEPLTDSPLILYHCSPSQNDLLLFLRCFSPENISILRSIEIFLAKHEQVMWEIILLSCIPHFRWPKVQGIVMLLLAKLQTFETIPYSFLLQFDIFIPGSKSSFKRWVFNPRVVPFHCCTISLLCHFIVVPFHCCAISLWFGCLLMLIIVGCLLFIDQRS